MRKVKPVRQLSAQFGRLLTRPKLDCYEIFEALEESGLIEGVAYEADGERDRPTHYRETTGKRMPAEEFESMIRDSLTTYCKERRL